MDHSDDKAGSGLPKGREVAPCANGSSELVAWAATAEPRRGETRSSRKRIIDAVSRAVLVAAGLGVGATVASFAFFGRPTLEATLSRSTPQPAPDPRASATESLLHRATDALAALKSEVEDLRAALARDRADTRSAGLEKRLDELAARLDSARKETHGSLAELAAKIDPFRQDATAKLQAVVERLDRLERRSEAETSAQARPPTAPAESRASNSAAKVASLASSDESARKQPVIRSWVLRDVYDGLALVEGAEGTIEVAPGEVLPGAGRVKSIERSGKGWIVVTSRGVIDRARGPLQP